MCTLFGVMAMFFSGIALAATAPTVTKLEFMDTNGTATSSDDKVITMTTGYKAYGVALDNKGNIYATDPDVNAVYKFNTNGHLVNVYRTVSVPVGVAVSDAGDLYVGGVQNGIFTIWVIDQAGNGKGPLGGSLVSLGVPSALALYQDNIVALYGNRGAIDVYDKNGVKLNTYGPFVERYDGPETIGSYSYARTRHRLISASGVAIDSSNGDLYVPFREYVDYLSNTSCGGTNPNCSEDRENSYTYYSNTDATYKYWYPAAPNTEIGSGASSRYQVAVIDKNGTIKRRIYLNTYSENATNPLDIFGVGLDESRRLYISTIFGVKVYDIDAGNALSVISGIFQGFAFDAVNKRLAATTDNAVNVYGIDGGTNPANTPPSSPSLITPAPNTYVNTRTPTLRIANATDPEGDPLTYGYELRDSSGNPIPGSSGIAAGGDGETSMVVNYTLSENASYSWHAQSFDGNAYSCWSDESKVNDVCTADTARIVSFCVNEKNDNPYAPLVEGPTNNTPSTPFSSYLIWKAATDPDCYDTVVYTVELSGKSLTVSGQSVKLGDLAGDLTNGGTYYWRVKAVDNNGGESAYSEGSFVYKTTVVKFESDKPDTKVYIDGNYGYSGRLLGKAPLEIQNIAPGSHFVTFVKAGYEPYHTIVNVTDPLSETGGLTTVAALMVKASRIKPAASGTELLKTSGNSTPFVVDYNNDGLKDVIAGDVDGNVYLYLSEEQLQEDGSKKVVLVAKGAIQNINVGSLSVPFVVDYDNDGKKDLLVGSGDGHIYLYLNTRDDAAPEFTSIVTIKATGSDITISNSAPNVVDYNNDGRKDLVVGGYDGKLRLYKNRVRSEKAGLDDAFPEFDQVYEFIKDDTGDISVNSDSKVFFTDWNSDGKKDMVVGSGAGTAHLYLNAGSDDSPDFRSITALQQWMIDKKRERGNREYIPYLGYNQDLGDLTGGCGDASPFVVDWNGLAVREVVVGSGCGNATVH